jgi:hypothetical protein
MIQVMARDLNLTNPAVVLLSSKRFDDRCAEWLRKSNIKSAALDAGATKAMIAQARAQLFPSA